MPSPYYLGSSPDEVLGSSPQFFYGLRRNDDGELYFVRNSQLQDVDAVELNLPDTTGETFPDFEAGVDYFDGVDADRNITYSALKYTQYKWDDRSIFYYIDSEGQLVMRINRGYTYPSGISSNG
jgi:hypothetical protein